MIRALTCIVIAAITCHAQDTTGISLEPWGGVGIYGAKYSTSRGTDQFHDLTNSAPDDAVGLNNMIAGLHVETADLFGALAFHYGDIPRSGWDPQLPWLYEAWVGYHVNYEVDVMAGAFNSTLGVESIFGFENYSGIISVPGFFDPNFYSGVQAIWRSSSAMSFNAGVVSSFSSFSMNAELPALLVGMLYVPNKSRSLSVQSMLSDETARSDAYMQWYTNISGTLQTDQLHVVSEVNLCYEIPSGIYPEAFMLSGLLGAYYDIGNDGFQTGLRIEAVYDPEGALADSRFDQKLPYKTLTMAGITATASYRPVSWGLIRLDARYLGTLDSKSFIETNPQARERTEVVLSADVMFQSFSDDK